MAISAAQLEQLAIPPTPADFSPFHAPPGWVTDFDAFLWHDGSTWWPHRPIIEPIMWVVHTNGGRGEGSSLYKASSANLGPQSKTHAHYNLNYPTPTKFVPSNRRGIGNSSGTSWELAHGTKDASFWTGVIETRDAGWPHPGHAGGFMDDEQIHDIELLARALAFEAIVAFVMGWLPGPIPARYPDRYGDPGMVTHTEPWPYPALTIQRGKVCPGDTKKQQMREMVLPHTQRITDAWFDDVTNNGGGGLPPGGGIILPPEPEPPTPEPEDDNMPTHLLNYRGLGFYHPDTLLAVDSVSLAVYQAADVPIHETDHAETFLAIIEVNGASHAARLGFRAHKNGVDLPGLEDELDD